jgi:chemotaxis protein MotB
MMLSAALLCSLSSACVSTEKYEAAVRSGDDARTELSRARSADAAALGDAQRKLDEANAELAKLHGELAQLGITADALSVEKGVLARALGQTRERVEQLARAQAAAETRARLYRDLAVRLKKMTDAGDLSIMLREGRMVLELPNDVLFASGQVDIKPRGKAALKELAFVLKALDGRRFQVAGHTDNVPIDTDRYRSNWELSTQRGVEVVRFLIGQGVSPNVLAAAGYGEFDPLVANDNDKNRAKNRRIEITLQPNVDEIVAVPPSP